MTLPQLLRALLRYECEIKHRLGRGDARWLVTVYGDYMSITSTQPTLLKALRETVGRMGRRGR